MIKIELTSEEENLFETAQRLNSYNEFHINSRAIHAAHGMMLLLFKRDGIPDNLINFFIEPKYQIGGLKKSRKAIFESNGTSGNDIFKHPHFIKCLIFFVNSANICKELYEFSIDAMKRNHFQGEARDEIIDMIKTKYSKYSNKEQGRKFGEEVFKLAVDVGFESNYCQDIYNTVIK